MVDKQMQTLLVALIAITILLMVAIAGLFVRMIQLQQTVIAAVAPLRGQAPGTDIADTAGIETGSYAPEFRLLDQEGKSVTSESFAGQETLLAFTSTRCPACEEMYPHIQTFSERNEAVRVYMVSHGSTEETQVNIDKYALSFPILSWSDEVAEAYQISTVPFFFFIDARGVVVNKGVANNFDQLVSLVAMK